MSKLSLQTVLAEKLQQDLNELTGKFKDQVEIVYRDKNVVCIIPKSQVAGNLYGRKTNWCSKSKMGFDLWSSQSIMFRFLFKTGRKIRLTYGYDSMYNWANEKGIHLFHYQGSDPFNFYVEERLSDMERDVIEHMKLIPDECKQKVIEIIQNTKDQYEYCKNDKEYQPYRKRKYEEWIEQLEEKYKDRIKEIESNRDNYFKFYYDTFKKKFTLCYDNSRAYEVERFDNIKELESRMVEIMKTFK